MEVLDREATREASPHLEVQSGGNLIGKGDAERGQKSGSRAYFPRRGPHENQSRAASLVRKLESLRRNQSRMRARKVRGISVGPTVELPAVRG